MLCLPAGPDIYFQMLEAANKYYLVSRAATRQQQPDLCQRRQHALPAPPTASQQAHTTPEAS